jgi:hypothetical protein
MAFFLHKLQSMRSIILLALLCSFSLCYMEWGGGQRATVGSIQWKILFVDRNPAAVLTHPLILSGLLGQLIILWSAVFPRTPAWATYAGIVLLAVVVLLVLLAGLLSGNARMVMSAMPFLVLAGIHVYRTRNLRKP